MKYIFTILILFLMTSCKKDDVTPTTSNVVHTYYYGKNTLIGYTGSFDYMFPDSNTKAGIKVRVLGGNKVIDSTLTDNTGRFQIDSLPVGTYDISISREGWATYKNKSVFCGPGPSPTVTYFENDNPYGNRINQLVKKVHSDILSVKMDSVGQSVVYFCMTINPNTLDSIDKLQPLIYWSRDQFNGQPLNEQLVISYEKKKFLPPNKIVFEVYRWGEWKGVTRKFDFILSSYFDFGQCQGVLNTKNNFEVLDAHKIVKDVSIVFPN